MLRRLASELRHATLWMADRISPNLPGGLPTVVHGMTPPEFDFAGKILSAMNQSGIDPREKHAALAELLLVEHAGKLPIHAQLLEYSFEGREPGDPPESRRRYTIRLSSGMVEAKVEGMDGWMPIYLPRDR